MARQIGKFVWHTLTTPNVEGALAFYTEVLGWGTMTLDMGDFEYNMLARGEQQQAGVVPPRAEGVPAHWKSHLSVEDVDATVAAVVANGGSVIAPPVDIPNIGRNAVVADPQGATFAVFTAANPDDEETVVDGFAWVELWSPDAEAVLPFYKAVFGFEVNKMDMPTGPYHILSRDGAQRAGVMTSPSADIPAMWLPYISVENTDEAFARASNHGGEIKQPPMDVPGVGRFGMLADSTGAVLGLITPAQS